jgi:hypothetical protein
VGGYKDQRKIRQKNDKQTIPMERFKNYRKQCTGRTYTSGTLDTPKCSVCELVGIIKGKSAIKIFDVHPELKKQY